MFCRLLEQKICVKESCKFYHVKQIRRTPENKKKYNTYDNYYPCTHQNNRNAYKKNQNKNFTSSQFTKYNK